MRVWAGGRGKAGGGQMMVGGGVEVVSVQGVAGCEGAPWHCANLGHRHRVQVG